MPSDQGKGLTRRVALKTALLSGLASGLPVSANAVTAQDEKTDRVSIDWKQTYGGEGSDIARSVLQTEDGGFVFTGRKTLNDGHFWLVKTDSKGAIEFERVLDGAPGKGDSVIQTADGGFAAAGEYGDGAVFKTDSQGETEFLETYPPHGAGTDDLVQTDEGGYAVDSGLVVGAWGNEAFLKVDANGELEFANDNYIENRVARPNEIIQTDDGGFALPGSLDLHEDSDAAFVKLDADGKLDFYTEYTTSGAAEAWSMVQTDDGGYAMVGGDGQRGVVESKSWFRKLNTEAEVEFKKEFEDSSDREMATSVVQTVDGGYALVGFAGDDASRDAWFRKLDANGNIEVETVFEGDNLDEARSLAQTADGGFIIAGRTRSSGEDEDDAWIIKTDSVCEIDAEITDFTVESGVFRPGELVEGQVTVKNTGDCQHEFFVGFGVIDQNGTIYDNDGGTGRPLLIPVGETETATIGWQVENDAEPGQYDAGTAIWKENNRDALETRLAETRTEDVFRVRLDEGARAREFDWSDFRKYKKGEPLMEKRDSIHNGWFHDSGSFAGRNLVGAGFGGQRSFSSSGFGVERFKGTRRETQQIELRYKVSGMSTVKSQSYIPVPIIGHNLLYFQLAIQDLSGNFIDKKRHVVYNKTVPELDDALTSIMVEGFKELLGQGHPLVGAGLTITDALDVADGADRPLREEYSDEGTITISTSDLEAGKEYKVIAEVLSITGVNLLSSIRLAWGVNDFLYNGEIDLFIR